LTGYCSLSLDLVFPVQVNATRFPALRFLVIDDDVAGNDDDVALARFPCGSAVEAYDAGVARAFYGIGRESLTVRDVVYRYLLIRQYIRGFQERFIDGYASFIMEIRIGHSRSMNFGFKHMPLHVLYLPPHV